MKNEKYQIPRGMIFVFLSIAIVWAFILPSISTPFLIMMFRQNSRNFPNDLMQAARIDGLSETGIFFRMYVPIMKSTYAAAAVITFRPCRHRDD